MIRSFGYTAVQTLETLLSAPQPSQKTVHRVTADRARALVPVFAPLIDLWEARRGDARAPCWRQMDFSDFLGWHPDIVMSSFDDDEPDPIYRIVGDAFAQMTNVPKRGMRFSEYAPELYESQLREHFRKLREEALIGVFEGQTAVVGYEHVHLQVLELPFRDGGERIDRLIHAVRRI